MARCKDCLYYKACKIWVEDTKKEFNFTPLLIPCAAFRNKADVVEVVRCGQCKYWKINPHNMFGGQCRYSECAAIDHYCSYGERKCEDGR